MRIPSLIIVNAIKKALWSYQTPCEISQIINQRERQFVSGAHYYFNSTVYPKKYAHGFCFAVLCCGYTLTDFPISIRLTSLALWQSNDCPSASKATLMNTDKYFMWIHYERLYNHNKAKHNKAVCIFLGIYCTFVITIKPHKRKGVSNNRQRNCLFISLFRQTRQKIP